MTIGCATCEEVQVWREVLAELPLSEHARIVALATWMLEQPEEFAVMSWADDEGDGTRKAPSGAISVGVSNCG